MSKKKGNKFDEVYNDFLVYASKRHKKQGFDALQRNFRNHILPYFKDKEITLLTKKDIIEWQNNIIDKDFSNSFNSTLFYDFSSFIEYCIKYSYLKENIVLQVGNFKKKAEVKNYDYYTLTEFRTFRKCLDNFIIKQFFNFMFFFGTRPSEAMALRFCDIEGNYIHIQHSIHRKGKRELDTPKNQSSIRYLKLSLIAKLRIFILRCYYIKHFGSCPEDYFIFGGKKPLSPTTIDRYKKNACKKANIREITQHQFRHSYATRMIHKNKPIDEVSKDLGHSKVSMTVDVYLHTKRGIHSTPHRKLFFFDALQRILKKIFQSIITRLIA